MPEHQSSTVDGRQFAGLVLGNCFTAIAADNFVQVPGSDEHHWIGHGGLNDSNRAANSETKELGERSVYGCRHVTERVA